MPKTDRTHYIEGSVQPYFFLTVPTDASATLLLAWHSSSCTTQSIAVDAAAALPPFVQKHYGDGMSLNTTPSDIGVLSAKHGRVASSANPPLLEMLDIGRTPVVSPFPSLWSLLREPLDAAYPFSRSVLETSESAASNSAHLVTDRSWDAADSPHLCHTDEPSVVHQASSWSVPGPLSTPALVTAHVSEPLVPSQSVHPLSDTSDPLFAFTTPTIFGGGAGGSWLVPLWGGLAFCHLSLPH